MPEAGIEPAIAPAVPPQVPPPQPAAPAAGSEPAAPITPESAPESPEGKEPETPTGEPQEKAGKSRFQRKLDAATRKFYEEKARADFYEKHLKEIQPSQADPNAPTLEKFNYDQEQYNQAAAKYYRDQGRAEYEAQQRATATKQATEHLTAQWEEKSERGSEKYDDFDSRVGELKPVNPLTTAIMQTDNADDVAYYLATHTKMVGELMQMDPVSQIRAIGKLEAKLLAEPPKPKTPSQAPAPIVPISGKASAAVSEDLETADMRTFIRLRNKQKGRK